jgi:hypothetical protein
MGFCSAFGPRFEKGRRVAGARPRVATNEKPHDQDHSETSEPSVKAMEGNFHLENLFDGLVTTTDDSFLMFDSLRDLAEELAGETFAGDIFCTGDECDLDCDIPKEWTKTKGEVEVENVMEFLGIRRAKPLRRAADWQ